jgi:hypothetical protein
LDGDGQIEYRGRRRVLTYDDVIPRKKKETIEKYIHQKDTLLPPVALSIPFFLSHMRSLHLHLYPLALTTFPPFLPHPTSEAVTHYQIKYGFLSSKQVEGVL